MSEFGSSSGGTAVLEKPQSATPDQNANGLPQPTDLLAGISPTPDRQPPPQPGHRMANSFVSRLFGGQNNEKPAPQEPSITVPVQNAEAASQTETPNLNVPADTEKGNDTDFNAFLHSLKPEDTDTKETSEMNQTMPDIAGNMNKPMDASPSQFSPLNKPESVASEPSPDTLPDQEADKLRQMVLAKRDRLQQRLDAQESEAREKIKALTPQVQKILDAPEPKTIKETIDQMNDVNRITTEIATAADSLKQVSLATKSYYVGSLLMDVRINGSIRPDDPRLQKAGLTPEQATVGELSRIQNELKTQADNSMNQNINAARNTGRQMDQSIAGMTPDFNANKNYFSSRSDSRSPLDK